MTFRTDRNNNPTAMITNLAAEGGLILGTDYETGDPFEVGSITYYTAKLLGDPIALTIKVIDKVGFYNTYNNQRWTYIAIPYFLWSSFDSSTKIKIIAWMYAREGGTELKNLFN